MSQENKVIIKPTVGRVVWFYPYANSVEAGFARNSGGEPYTAFIARVWSDHMVNLTVLDADGKPHSRTSVELLHGEVHPGSGGFCAWMPYQVGQAQKAEQDLTERIDRAVKQAIGEYFKPGPIVAAPNLIGLPVHAMTDMGAGLNPHREGGVRRDAGIAQFGKSLAPVPLPDEVVAEHGFTLYEAVKALGHPAHEELKRITLCMQVLDNGHVVIGQSACADMKTFDAALGERYAREDAREKLAELKAFRQRDARHTWAKAYGKS